MGCTLSITFLRHGLTRENQQKQYVGWSDVDLCKEGRQQLVDYKQFGYPDADVFIVSDLKRCKETFDTLYHNKTAVTYSEDFREMNFGEWELKTYEQLKDNEDYIRWLENSSANLIPSGENFCDFEKRVLNGWLQVVSRFDNPTVQKVVIISHGGPIRLLLERFAPEKKGFWEWQITHGTGFTLTTTIERLRRNERCISLLEVPFREKNTGSLHIIN